MMKTGISLIAAMGRNRIIGKDKQMPWHHPADLKHFKAMTLGKPILMGRRTFESIGRPLPGRENIVITSDRTYQAAGITVFSDLDTAILHAKQQASEVMIIGGANLYEQCLPFADTLYLTILNHDYAGDTFFPSFASADWQEVTREDHPADERHEYNYSFVTLKRRALKTA